ncbi:hypothetical protein [Sphingomonas sp. Root241]|nr:hypothetical protein [Sphingomonas sp. Root241]
MLTLMALAAVGLIVFVRRNTHEAKYARRMKRERRARDSTD